MKSFKTNFAAKKLTKKEAQSIKAGKKEPEAECLTSVPEDYKAFCSNKEVFFDGNGCFAGCF